MVLTYGQALHALELGKVSPVYLLYGEESYLQEKLIQQIKSVWLSEVLPEFNDCREDGTKLTGAQIADLANELPFMAERRLLRVDNPACIPCNTKKEKKPEAEEELSETTKLDSAKASDKSASLLNYLQQPADTTCLIFWCRQGHPDRRSKLVSAIDKLGGMVEIGRLKPAEALRELRHMGQASGKSFGPDALEYLAKYSQPDLRMLAGELDKVITFAGDAATVDKRMVKAVMTPSLEADIFNMVDALGRKQTAEAIRQLRGLLTRGEPGLRILSMMVRQFRLIFQAKLFLQKGYAKPQIAQALGCHPYVAEKATQQSRNFKLNELENIMQQLLQTDFSLKDGKKPGQALEELVIIIINSFY